MMKRLMILLAMLLALCIPACAEQQAEESALQVMLEKHLGYEVLSCDQWGDTAAAALGQGNERILCVAERKDGVWTLVIDNPKALPQGAEVSIFMDTDISLFWSIRDVTSGEEITWQYSCFRGAEQWGEVDCIRMALSETSLVETSLHWENDTLKQVTEYRDVNENLIRREETAAIPAKWMCSYRSLQNYDADLLPVMEDAWHHDGWLSEYALRLCAGEIAPEYTFVAGAAKEDGVEMIMQEANGTLRLVTCACYDGMPITNISSPLPENTHYGYENFWDAIAVNDHSAAGVSPYADGVWAVHYTWPMTSEGDILNYGRGWISCDGTIPYGRFYVGDHPWEDISTTDWSTLPASLDEALEHLDASRWAVVNNPDPADRLHLRDRADRDSRTYGKYYNGTPVEVLEKGDVWTRVRVCGRTGWMMTEYLAFNEDAWEVKHAFPQLHFAEEGSSFPVWKTESISSSKRPAANGDWTVEKGENFCIVGILGDTWYHVWFPGLNEGGYMRQSDFWEGNG